MYLYACRLNKGDEQNKKEAFLYFKQSSDLGNSDATLEYAWMLDNDELIQSSKEEISHYYQLSISQNKNNIKANFIVLINMIIEKIQSPTILITKLQSFAPILKSIKIIIKNQEQINEKSFTKFHKELLTLSGFVENLNNENWCINFLKSEKSIQNFVSEIDTNISNIFSILKQKFNLIFKIPTINIYDDMKQISDFLSKPQYLNDPSFQNRRIEISNFFKPTKNLLIQIVEKFGRKYMLSENDYKKTVILSQTENYEIFEGEKNLTNEKLKIFVLKKIENFELLFKILTEIDGIQKVEKFYGALVTESSTELAIYTRGEPFKSENICLTIYAFKIAQVMSHLHSKLIIHRDLNLSNIYVDNFDENDPTKVTPIVTNFVNSVFLTKSSFLGMPNFTPVSPFSAPELKHNFRYDEKADVFAFGGILYQFVTGKPPFDGLSYQKVQQLLIDNERPNFEDDISPDIKNLIRNCWHQKTKKHFFKSDDGYLPQICRYSFDQIIYEMSSKKIVFPSDFDKKELIEKFYEDYTFKNDQSAQILDLFESCISGIDCVAQFKFEFYNSRLVLIQNKKAFLDSISKKTLNETEMTHVENLKNDLDSLLNLIIKAQSNEIIDYIKKEINHFTKNLNDLMQKVEESMKILCCEKVEKYIEDEEDLIFDYNELKFYIYKEYVSEENPAFDYSKYRECDRILDIYIKKQKIGNITKKKLYSTVKSLLSSYKDREIDRGNFYYEKDAENDGAESLVYKGVYMKTGQRVAIKMVKNDYLKNLKNLICLKREINYLVTINHEFMQKFIGFSVSDCISGKMVWLISEYISNRTLTIAKFNMNYFELTKVAFQIAEVMEYLHSRRIIHRDLKPDNIMICNKSPILIDFGLSRNELGADTITTEMGTYNYMAPEVFKNEYGRSVDVYSYAMILWELYSKIVPFAGKKMAVISNEISNGIRPEFDDNCPDGLRNLIIKGWSADPKSRPTFTEIIELMIKDKISFIPKNETDKVLLDKIISFYSLKSEERKKNNL